VLSLIFVPAMFMMMDDLGQLCWRFGKRLLSSSSESEDPEAAPSAIEHK
jgi:hypothetical protein